MEYTGPFRGCQTAMIGRQTSGIHTRRLDRVSRYQMVHLGIWRRR